VRRGNSRLPAPFQEIDVIIWLPKCKGLSDNAISKEKTRNWAKPSRHTTNFVSAIDPIFFEK
jgi:hypothetical protein